MNDTNPFGITKTEIVELAAQKLADQLADIESLSDLVGSKIEARIKILFETSLNSKVDAFLAVEMERILSQEICPVTIWGDKIGKPTTLKNVLNERAKEFWNLKVSEDGKPCDSYYGKPRHEWLFAKIVKDEFAAAVKQNIVNLVGSFKDAISANAQQITKEHIDSIIKVKTSRD